MKKVQYKNPVRKYDYKDFNNLLSLPLWVHSSAFEELQNLVHVTCVETDHSFLTEPPRRGPKGNTTEKEPRCWTGNVEEKTEEEKKDVRRLSFRKNYHTNREHEKREAHRNEKKPEFLHGAEVCKIT